MKLMCCGGSNGTMDMEAKNSNKEDEAVGKRKWSNAPWLDNTNGSVGPYFIAGGRK